MYQYTWMVWVWQTTCDPPISGTFAVGPLGGIYMYDNLFRSRGYTIIIKWNIHIRNKLLYKFVRKQVTALNTRPHNFATIWSNGVNSGFINWFRTGRQSKVPQDIPKRSWSILALQEEVNVRLIPSLWFQLIYQLTKRDADTRNEYVSLKISPGPPNWSSIFCWTWIIHDHLASTFETYSDRPAAPTITKHPCEKPMTLPSVILLQRVRVIQPCMTLLQQVCNDSINHATVEGPEGVRLNICAMKHVQCGYYSL